MTSTFIPDISFDYKIANNKGKPTIAVAALGGGRSRRVSYSRQVPLLPTFFNKWRNLFIVCFEAAANFRSPALGPPLSNSWRRHWIREFTDKPWCLTETDIYNVHVPVRHIRFCYVCGTKIIAQYICVADVCKQQSDTRLRQ